MTTASRGYGAEHQAERQAWEPYVQAGGIICSRYGQDPDCPGEIKPGDEWDLDHTDNRDGYNGPAHARCNRRAGALKAAARRRAPRPRSRKW